MICHYILRGLQPFFLGKQSRTLLYYVERSFGYISAKRYTTPIYISAASSLILATANSTPKPSLETTGLGSTKHCISQLKYLTGRLVRTYHMPDGVSSPTWRGCGRGDAPQPSIQYTSAKGIQQAPDFSQRSAT